MRGGCSHRSHPRGERAQAAPPPHGGGSSSRSNPVPCPDDHGRGWQAQGLRLRQDRHQDGHEGPPSLPPPRVPILPSLQFARLARACLRPRGAAQAGVLATSTDACRDCVRHGVSLTQHLLCCPQACETALNGTDFEGKKLVVRDSEAPKKESPKAAAEAPKKKPAGAPMPCNVSPRASRGRRLGTLVSRPSVPLVWAFHSKTMTAWKPECCSEYSSTP